MASVAVTIDNMTVEVEEGTTVFEAARAAGIHIPGICAMPGINHTPGACRLCLVKIEGMRGFPSSCTTPASDGMVVHTDTEQLRELRGNILGLMLLEHPGGCLVCSRRELCDEFRPAAEKAGRTTGCHTCSSKDVCEVRSLSEELGVCRLPVPPNYHNRPIERNDPFIDRDLNLCILCGRCVQICKHKHGTAIIDFVGRSSECRIGQAFGRSLKDAGCRFCGSCVDVCPTGSLSDRYSKWFGKPESWVETTCIFCDGGCALAVGVKNAAGVTAHSVDEDMPLCVLGRFGTAEFLNGVRRLRKARVRVGSVLREKSMDEAVQAVADGLREFTGSRFACVCDGSISLEDRYVFRKFTEKAMKSPNYIELTADTRGYARTSLPEGVEAVMVAGDLLDPGAVESARFLVVLDCYPTAAADKADVVLPVAVLAETEGTVRDSTGNARPLFVACEAPGDARQDWRIVSQIASGIVDDGFNFRDIREIAREADLPRAELYRKRTEAPPAGADRALRRAWFRGHLLDSLIGGLRELPVEGVPAPEEAGPAALDASSCPEAGERLFEIQKKREISPNNHEIVFYAPAVARKALPGQFVIVMADETSERVPYTLCGWDESSGTITLIVQEKGQSSRKLALMREGDAAAHIVGPLGTSIEIKNYGTVILAGGCYGIGAVRPIARAMKQAGNRVVVISEARSRWVAYYERELAEEADEFIQATVDGSSGVKGHAVDVVVEKLAAGESVDLIVSIGCPFMMMIMAGETRPYGVKTLAALNPIMVDGTGMCGACRVTVGDKTRFACVDGPFFDAHEIDWNELKDRRNAYSPEEIRSLQHTEPVERIHHACEGACK